MYPFCTPKRGIQGFSPSNLFYKFHFSLKSCDIPKFMCEIPGKYLIFGENTDKFRSIYAVKICPSLFASFMPLLGYNVRGYMNFTMLLHVFSNVPPHSILFWGTRIKGTFFPLSKERNFWFLKRTYYIFMLLHDVTQYNCQCGTRGCNLIPTMIKHK